MTWLLIVLLAVLAVSFGFLAWRSRQDAKSLRDRYSAVINIDDHLAVAKNSLERTRREQQEIISAAERQRLQLSQEYTQARAVYERLKKEISLLEENLEDISFGLYKPHFSFESSEEYKTQLEQARDKERELIRSGNAAVCLVAWTVGGSAKEGKRMAKQNTKLLLRAFNGECDACIANVTWNNATKMEERIRKSFDAINELATVLQVRITEPYLALKLDELRLTHEYEDKRYQEREEQRRIREKIREEERAAREIEKAREEAEEEETRYHRALEKARAEAGQVTGEQLERLSQQIQSLESKLAEAHANKERAISRAQLTKSGFVYIISNIGSFGERVYKVGMTRRLEPKERILELGDASVPFPFDLHVMIYCEDAPELESALHEYLHNKRVNLVNPRKEFYFDIDVEDLERFVRKRGVSAQFVKTVEAKEYRETLAMRAEQVSQGSQPQPRETFPEDVFRSAGT